MSNNTTKWLTGCGIGCAVIIAIAVLIIMVGYMLVKNTINEFKETETSTELVEERFGKARDFCPRADGKIEAERMEAFLTVRDSIAGVSAELEKTLLTIAGEIEKAENKEIKPFNMVMNIVGKGIKAIPLMVEFYKVRNYALLETNMGLGEYYYIYILTYYSYLGKPPEDGPDFQLAGDNKDGKKSWHYDDSDEDMDSYKEEVKRERRYRIVKKIHRLFHSMLSCQLEELETSGSLNQKRSLKRKLKNEIQALNENRERIPWQDGLPDIIKQSFEPYKLRLNESYNEMVNAVELNPNRK
ncbi:hypothetical protein H8E88_29270 [candidate division KSB1 bacterium]|nr:hypothetical protein [candidate division KSB1 bacterium]MBL7094645.1 hypothetical protein [candidate division KSB1 bacterium]